MARDVSSLWLFGTSKKPSVKGINFWHLQATNCSDLETAATFFRPQVLFARKKT
jgi:hypothetical protein